MTIFSDLLLNIHEMINVVNNFMWSYLLIVLLIGAGLYFSFKTKFVQFRMLKEMFYLLGNGLGKKEKKGGVSSFQAFCISTASRVGTGNIAGVAMAIAIGGPGAVFWMWIIALIGGASSFIESTLAQIYKVKNEDGSYRGGPAYYMEKGLNKKWMGVIFSILISITFGLIFNAVQSNTVTMAFETAFGVDKGIMGIVLSVLTAIIIFGGVKKVAKISEIIVPIFATLYIVVATLIVLLNIKYMPEIFKLIIESAFGLKEFAVGAISATIMQGVKRGLFSNEAGMGSAPNASATADVTHPAKQGLLQTLGVFTDTLVICTCTAFIVLVSGSYMNTDLTGIQLTQNALSSQIGNLGDVFIAICIFLFAFTSIIGNYSYGESNIEFLHSNKLTVNIYRVLVVAMVMFGALTQVAIVWDLADLFMALMAILNIIAIVLLRKIAIETLKDYENQKKEGKDPIFNASNFEELKGKTVWEN